MNWVISPKLIRSKIASLQPILQAVNMPYMEQTDFSGLIKLTLPVIDAVDWLLSDFLD